MSVPYIGAKISLTSRSQVRYEGILASVNPVDSTITLEEVRIMGTEGRTAGRELLPSSDIYEIVIFRSNDIEDLQIFEPPAAVAVPPVPEPFVDPAIISSNQRFNQSQQPIRDMSTSGVSAGGWPAAPRLQFGSAQKPAPIVTQPSPHPPQQPQISAPSKTEQARQDTQFRPVPPRPNHSWTQSPHHSRPAVVRPPTFGSLAAVKPNFPPAAAPVASNASGSIKAHSSTQTSSQPGTFMSTQSNDDNTAEKVKAYNTGTGKIEMVERQSRSYASVLSDGNGRFRAAETTTRMVPRTEYDFEHANSRLQMSREELPTAPKEQFYDKTSSFFDNISCESTVGKDGKFDKNERRWNIETFGIAAPSGANRYTHYRGGRRGGYQSRGSRGRDRHD